MQTLANPAEFFGTTGTITPMPQSEEDAIRAELAERIETYGGYSKYARDFGVNRSNLYKLTSGPAVPSLSHLLMHLRNLGIGLDEFFAAVTQRTR